MLKKLLVALALLAVGPASAQWQVPNNTIPIGRGAGVTGFASAANTGTGSLCFLNTIPPAFGTCPAGNLPAGVDTNTLNAQTANYTIANTDCGKTIQAGTGSTGKFTVTLPSISGFAATCTVTVANGDTARGKLLSGFPTGVAGILFPLQTVKVSIVNGAWTTIQNPGRWRPSSTVTLNIDNVNGSDTVNDGLGTGATGAFASFSKAWTIALDNIDKNDQTVIIQAASGQSWTNFAAIGTTVGNGALVIDLGGGTLAGSGANALAVQNTLSGNIANNTLLIQNITITCSGGVNGLDLVSGFVAINTGVTFGACPGGAQIESDGPARIFVIANYTISGDASFHWLATAQGLIDFNLNVTVTLIGTPAFSQQFANAQMNATIFSLVTFSGSATGTRWSASLNGIINISGGTCDAILPGNANGSAITGGVCNSVIAPLPSIAADSLLANFTGSSAPPIATVIGSCSGATNALIYNTSTHALGCNTISAGAATSITAGTTTVTGGPGVLSNASSGGVLVSSTTLPSSLTAPSFTVTGAFTATGLVTNADLANSSTTINGTTISLGTGGTVTAAAGTLTGTTLNSTVVTSSLTSVGTLTGGSTGAGFTIALGTSTISGIFTGTNGGTGVNNGASTITLAGNLVVAGAFSHTITATAASNSTLPAGTDTLGGLGTQQSWLAANTYSITRTIASGASIVLDDWNVAATTTTVTGTTGITTAKGFNKASIYAPTYTDASVVAITNAATLYLDGPPVAAGSLTITNPYVLRTGAGNVQFNTGGTAPVLFYQNANYNVLSVNNVLGGFGATQMGLIGGAVGDPNTLYVVAPGALDFVVNGGALIQVTGNGLVPVTGNTTSTGSTSQAWLDAYSNAFVSAGTKPVGTTGTCVASAFAGGATAGTFSAAVCTATNTFILSSMPTAPTGYSCDATDRTTSTARLRQTATSTTSATFTVDVATIASDVVAYKCTGW